MSALFDRESLFLRQVNELLTDLDVKLANSEMVKFIKKHELVLCDISLIAMDVYCFYQMPLIFIGGVIGASIKPDYIDRTVSKIERVWKEHPKLQPLAIGAGIMIGSLSPLTFVSICSAVYSVKSLGAIPESVNWAERAKNLAWNLVPKTS